MYTRIVIKVGTKVLSSANDLDVSTLTHLVEQIVAIKKLDIEIILVSSGAMGAGRSIISLTGTDKIAEKQVLAAVGQVRLMSVYADSFRTHGAVCAQVLATKEDFRDKQHYFNMRTCFENLIKSGVVPIVNENDVVATTELLFTDNDELAGLVASQLGADAVIILTSVEGFLMSDPNGSSTKVISEITCDNAHTYQKYISPEKTAFGRGGMLTKFNIAKKLAQSGVAVHFANGKRPNVIIDIISGKILGTKFVPHSKLSALKRRIAYSEGLTKGTICINNVVAELLQTKTKIMSILPIGVTKVTGEFNKGDIVEVITNSGERIGFGIAGYSATKTKELVGTKNARAIIHYNHLFINT